MIILLFGSMLFTGYTGSAATAAQTGTQTEWLYFLHSKIKKDTAAYHFTSVVPQPLNLFAGRTHSHTCFLFHHNRIFKINFKALALLSRQFVISQWVILQKTTPLPSPEFSAIS